MDLIATRIITDVEALVSFYERVTGVVADRIHPLFAELRTASGTLAISSSDPTLADKVETFVNEPTTMPWGNRSLLFRDPDGNLVNFFTPVTDRAQERSAR
ncbi:MAG: VOC family protein [Actinomycetota bacterium]|nr:VOC family protein [Actinomycetota bacterium]